jgi:carbamoyltransferase
MRRADEEYRFGFSMHDAAAALVQDGELVAAIEEERLDRLKHSNTFPTRAMQFCLSHAGISLRDIDCVAFSTQRAYVDKAAWFKSLVEPQRPGTWEAASFLGEYFDRAFGVDVRSKLHFCPHHIAHAWSAFGPCGYDESLILVVDGDGDGLSGMILLGRGTAMETLRTFSMAKSLGQLYTWVIALIGFSRFDEYKAMGLAPYGDPTVFRPLFEEGVRLLPSGDYELDSFEEWFSRFRATGLTEKGRRSDGPITQLHKDIAAALQERIEQVLLHVLSYYQRETGQQNLCLAGGVAHNCSANGAILYSGLFDRVFVQPAAHDAGSAYGAAVQAASERGACVSRARWATVYFGADVGSNGRILECLKGWGDLIRYEANAGSLEATARMLASGAVAGWVQGRSEFGPRALGNRSILADPRPAENRARINALIKKREEFRPFAPVVLLERFRDYFDVPTDQDEFPFMVFVLKVHPHMRERLGAVTHIDGTARVQTVSHEQNPSLWSLIRAFERETGIGMLLNTSFNNNAEPIVQTVDDAVACFLTSGLDLVVIGDYLVQKTPQADQSTSYGMLAPSLPRFRRLVTRRMEHLDHPKLESAFVLESTRSTFFGPMDVPISESMARVLTSADGRASFADLVAGAGVSEEAGRTIWAEAAQLWSSRAIHLHPPR